MASDPDVLASPALHAILTSTFGAIRIRLVAIVRQGIDAGEFEPDVDPELLAETVLAVVQGGYVLARIAGDAAVFDRAVRGAVALITAIQKETRP
jgi:TetR/AcrR family transcriptional repressor of nem operon